MKEHSHANVALAPLGDEMERPAEMVTLRIPADEVEETSRAVFEWRISLDAKIFIS